MPRSVSCCADPGGAPVRVRAGARRAAGQRTVRTVAEQYVYARDHGDRFGLGTYDHRPMAVGITELGIDAEQPWMARVFDPAVATALDLLSVASRFNPERRLNGVFSMTPDNLPLARPDGGHRRVVGGRSLVGHPRLRRSASIGSDDDRQTGRDCGLGGPGSRPVRRPITRRTHATRPEAVPRHLRHTLNSAAALLVALVLRRSCRTGKAQATSAEFEPDSGRVRT